MKLCVVFLLVSVLRVPVAAQGGAPDIQKLVAQVNEGGSEQVREQLPALLTDYPNNPGVLYLQALLTREGADAVRTYQSIVDNFPQSEWADDALYKIHQFYYALGLYSTAQLKLDQLKATYPASPYVRQAALEPPADTGMPRASETQPPAEPPAVSLPAPQTQQSAGQQEATTDPPLAQPQPVTPAGFALQVGAFTVHANAEALMARFEAKGYSAEMISKVKDTRSLFIVLVGDYPTYDEAKAAVREVKRTLGVNGIVVPR